MKALDSKDLLIRMWDTPNPYALKFVLNIPLKNKGRATFHSPKECSHLPVFSTLFDIKGIKQLFVFQNQLTVTHDGTLATNDMEKQVSAVVKTRMALHNPDFLSPEEEDEKEKHNNQDTKNALSKKMSPELLAIEKILDHHIRPGLRADGGDLEVLSVENNEVRISYQGACGGCPSAMMGTLSAIENILQNEMAKPQLKVIPI